LRSKTGVKRGNVDSSPKQKAVKGWKPKFVCFRERAANMMQEKNREGEVEK